MGTNYPHLSARTRWLKWAGATAGRRQVYTWGRFSELKATYYKRHKARGTWLSSGCGDVCGRSGPRLVALLRRPSEEDSGGKADWKGGFSHAQYSKDWSRKVKC